METQRRLHKPNKPRAKAARNSRRDSGNGAIGRVLPSSVAVAGADGTAYDWSYSVEQAAKLPGEFTIRDVIQRNGLPMTRQEEQRVRVMLNADVDAGRFTKRTGRDRSRAVTLYKEVKP